MTRTPHQRAGWVGTSRLADNTVAGTEELGQSVGTHGAVNRLRVEADSECTQCSTVNIKACTWPGSKPGPQLQPPWLGFQTNNKQKISILLLLPLSLQLRKAFQNFRTLRVPVPTAFYLLVTLPKPHCPATNDPSKHIQN